VKDLLTQLKISFKLLLLITLITGIIYPFLLTGLAQLFFPWQANGSIVYSKGQAIGSLLIGQGFSDDKYFWSRPSATAPVPYDPANSNASNLGPSNPAFLSLVQSRVRQWQTSATYLTLFLPVDLVTASASGVDPDISILAAYYQVPRVAQARHLSEEALLALIERQKIHRTLRLFGELRINVLQLNLALDQLNHD